MSISHLNVKKIDGLSSICRSACRAICNHERASRPQIIGRPCGVWSMFFCGNALRSVALRLSVTRTQYFGAFRERKQFGWSACFPLKTTAWMEKTSEWMNKYNHQEKWAEEEPQRHAHTIWCTPQQCRSSNGNISHYYRIISNSNLFRCIRTIVDQSYFIRYRIRMRKIITKKCSSPRIGECGLEFGHRRNYIWLTHFIWLFAAFYCFKNRSDHIRTARWWLMNFQIETLDRKVIAIFVAPRNCGLYHWDLTITTPIDAEKRADYLIVFRIRCFNWFRFQCICKHVSLALIRDCLAINQEICWQNYFRLLANKQHLKLHDFK